MRRRNLAHQGNRATCPQSAKDHVLDQTQIELFGRYREQGAEDRAGQCACQDDQCSFRSRAFWRFQSRLAEVSRLS